MSSTTKRTDDEAIILALLSSRTQAEASRKLGINSNLISERKQDKEFIAKYKEIMGITVSMGEKNVADEVQILFLVLCGVAALAVSVWIVRKKGISDR